MLYVVLCPVRATRKEKERERERKRKKERKKEREREKDRTWTKSNQAATKTPPNKSTLHTMCTRY
jgi:uncharacterized Zn finger protein (UPF0148 family)